MNATNHFLKKIYRILLLYPLLLVPYWIGHLLPRDPRLWVFANSYGGFGDNSRYLLEYVHETQADISTCWLARTPIERDRARAAGYRAELLGSLQGLRAAYKAGVGFAMFSPADFNRATLGGMKLVQLWHGTPLKKQLNDSRADAWWIGRWYEGLVNFVRKRIMPYGAAQYAMVTCAAPIMAQRLSSALDMPISRFAITGFARSDIILGERGETPACLLDAPRGAKVVLYTPTWRFGGSSGFGADFDFEEWESLLQELDAVLLIKLHPLGGLEPDLANRVAHSQRMKLMPHAQSEDINRVLPFADVLVTDYSSIMFDYAPLHRPIILFATDLEDYSSDRGLYERYEDLAEGRWATSWRTFALELRAVWENPTWHLARTRRLAARYVHFHDTHSRERIVRSIRELLMIGSRS